MLRCVFCGMSEPACLSFLHLFHSGDAADAFVFDGEGGDGIGEVDGGGRVGVAREVDEEGGGEDVARAGGVDLAGAVGGEASRVAVLVERGAVATVGGDEQGDALTPVGEDGISFSAVAVSKGQQVIVTEDEGVETGQYLFGSRPGSGPDAAIGILAA